VEEKIVGMMTEQDTEGGNKQLGLSVKVERGDTCDVILYAPYWIINKTSLPLQLRVKPRIDNLEEINYFEIF
jgi:hypothetical protein